MRVLWSLTLSLSLLSPAQAFDAPLEDYHKVPGVSGNLLSVGSDTLAGMTTLWVEEFKSLYPNINAQVQASGSSTAPPALNRANGAVWPDEPPDALARAGGV